MSPNSTRTAYRLSWIVIALCAASALPASCVLTPASMPGPTSADAPSGAAPSFEESTRPPLHPEATTIHSAAAAQREMTFTLVPPSRAASDRPWVPSIHERAGAAPEPNATISLSSGDWEALTSGKLDAFTALLQGRLKIDGDMGLATRLPALFGM